MATAGEAYARERRFKANKDHKQLTRHKLLKLLARTQLDELMPQTEKPWHYDRTELERVLLQRWNPAMFDKIVETLRFCRCK